MKEVIKVLSISFDPILEITCPMCKVVNNKREMVRVILKDEKKKQ